MSVTKYNACMNRNLHLFVATKHIVTYCNKGYQATQVSSPGIEASQVIS